MTPAERERRDRKNAVNKKRTDRRQTWMRKIRMAVGCAICGYNEHPSALDFDHLDPATKRFSIPRGLNHSLKVIFNEIRKCRILCANCHRICTDAQWRRGEIKARA